MKRFFMSLAALVVVGAPALANARSNLEGRWKNGRMEIVIRPCGGALCGTVVKASARQQAKAQRGSGTRLIGSRVIDNIHPTGSGVYKADVYVADRDMNARGTIRVRVRLPVQDDQLGPRRPIAACLPTLLYLC